MATKNANVQIRPDQVWADRQRGQEGRTVRIVAVQAHVGAVEVETLTPTDNAFKPAAAIGRRGRIALNTLRRNFELVKDVPSPDDQAHAAAADQLKLGQALAEALAALDEHMTESATVDLNHTGSLWVATLYPSETVLSPPRGIGPTSGAALIDAVQKAGWLS